MPKLPKEPSSSEVTPEALYLRRREFIKNAALFAGTTTAIGGGLLLLTRGGPPATQSSVVLPTDPPAPGPQSTTPPPAVELKIAKRKNYAGDEAQNSFEQI